MLSPLVLAVLLAAPAAAAGPAKKVEISSAAVSAANGRLAALCSPKELPVDSLLSDAGFLADSATFTGEDSSDLFAYAVCRELQGASGPCAALDKVGPDPGSSAKCRIAAADARFLHATLAGGDAQAACRTSLVLDGKRGPAADKECAAMIGLVRSEGASLSCASLERAGLVIPGDSCADIQAFWSGDTLACERDKQPYERRDCLARAALAAGLRDRSRCAASPACRALVEKSPKACDGLRARFSRTLCARVAKDVAAEKARAAAEPERRRREEALIRQKTAKREAAEQAKLAAEQARVAAAGARARAEAAAEQEKLAKQAAANAAKAAAAEADVKAKAEVHARKAAAAKALKPPPPQFKKGAPMKPTPPEVQAIIKAIEENRPLPEPAPAPKK